MFRLPRRHEAEGDVKEAKTQDAIAASQDPNNKTTAADAERVMLDESRRAGAQTFDFDPNASPEDKAAQAVRSHHLLDMAVLGPC